MVPLALRVDAAAHSVSGLHDDDAVTLSSEETGGGQTRDSRSDDDGVELVLHDGSLG